MLIIHSNIDNADKYGVQIKYRMRLICTVVVFLSSRLSGLVLAVLYNIGIQGVSNELYNLERNC